MGDSYFLFDMASLIGQICMASRRRHSARSCVQVNGKRLHYPVSTAVRHPWTPLNGCWSTKKAACGRGSKGLERGFRFRIIRKWRFFGYAQNDVNHKLFIFFFITLLSSKILTDWHASTNWLVRM